jgi:mitochondrial fission protein ELM1
MREAGITRPFAGRIEDWSYPPLDETGRVAAEVKRRLEDHLRRP